MADDTQNSEQSTPKPEESHQHGEGYPCLPAHAPRAAGMPRKYQELLEQGPHVNGAGYRSKHPHRRG